MTGLELKGMIDFFEFVVNSKRILTSHSQYISFPET